MVKNLHISILLLIFAIGIVGGHGPMIRELSTSPFPINKVDITKKLNNMKKKLTLSEVIDRFNHIHKGKYDYSLITEENYIDTNHKVLIKCNTCGRVWEQRPCEHYNGQGCPNCAAKIRNLGKKKTRNQKVYGVGVNDYDGCVNDKKGTNMLSYKCWRRMLQRCYDTKFLEKHPTYNDCSVCEEWLRFSNFKQWFDENYIKGYDLDKDLLIKGNKVYNPEACCFVPHKINSLILGANHKRGNLPIGVSQHNGKYLATHQASKTWGKYYDTPEDAFATYKSAKESHIQEMATQFYKDGKITEKVYNALMNYVIEITD